jgi:hypothetical protein
MEVYKAPLPYNVIGCYGEQPNRSSQLIYIQFASRSSNFGHLKLAPRVARSFVRSFLSAPDARPRRETHTARFNKPTAEALAFLPVRGCAAAAVAAHAFVLLLVVLLRNLLLLLLPHLHSIFVVACLDFRVFPSSPSFPVCCVLL